MPIKEKILQIIQSINSEYFTAKQLCCILQTRSTTERRIVAEVLQQLCDDCQVIFDASNRRYRRVNEKDFGRATFDANPRGFGFLLCDEGEDLFVPANRTHGAFHRDTVLYRRVKGTADCAEIVKVISRGMTEVVGTYDTTNHTRFVLPDDKKFAADIYVAPKRDFGAKNGQKVVVKITSYPSDNRNNPEGEIVQVLGYPEDKDVDMMSVACAYGLSRQFPDECEILAQKLPQTVLLQELSGRRDLRNQRIFTIDGEDAKDLDDAVSVSRNDDGSFNLGVHIADVSHYVKVGDAIDRQAFARGTSVYFPDMVFPMLPTALSNGVCSLYEKVDRLTLSCQMTVDGKGVVTDCDIFPSVINSRHRMTYTEVQGILDGDSQLRSTYNDIAEDIFTMAALAKILQDKRNRRGNVDFATKEVRFVQQDGKVVDVVPFRRTFAHQLIEEFMILANESVAEYAAACDFPFVYRVHEKPDSDKFQTLLALLGGVGIKVKHTQEAHSMLLQDALTKAQQTPYFNLVSDVMLRTMKKAKYSQLNSGHFGLASNCYCHFTSPIRRYADLTVHRVLKTAICGKMTEKAFAAYVDLTADAAKQASLRERVADEAERKADDVKKCNYAENLVGQVFAAIVSGVTERGIFCELENTVEGFVPVEKLGNLQFDRQKFCLSGGNVKYCLGDSVRVKVSEVDCRNVKIYFELV